ncbi:MAG: glutaredoxin family protein [Mycobacterium sp.]
MTITLYSSNPNCQPCRLTKAKLARLGLDYAEASPTDEVMATVRALGLELTAPIVQAGDDIWTGFRPDRIDALASAINAA